VVTAHAVDSSARGRAGGAKEEMLEGRVVGQAGGAEEELAKSIGAAGNVASDEIGVIGFELQGRFGRASEDDVFEAGGEALDLRFDGGSHVGEIVGGDVTVGPSDLRIRGEWRVVTGEQRGRNPRPTFRNCAWGTRFVRTPIGRLMFQG